MASNEIFFARGDSPKMMDAFKNAQQTFKYFWREWSWENRRIIPALTVACVKVAFSQRQADQEDPLVEHMWINEVDFDGINIRGVLVNSPNALTNIANGDFVEIPLEQISDWLFAIPESKPKGISRLFSGNPLPRAYGGFTIQAMRSDMSAQERKEHDKAWGLEFGDYNETLIVSQQKEYPENLAEHPMSKNMREKLIEFIKDNPDELTHADEEGYTLLHRETIAGNKTSVEVLLAAGMDKDAKTNQGYTALDFAAKLDWQHIIPLFETK
ncbi:DUF2314 domain-containing protein [Sphingobacterium spiritivorum]|uniref:DUF2314 domain-containing protein n=1 Tax=Sphingobacterium spiritivorum TaxID=258 RepID=UPI003DA3E7E8